MYNRQLRIIFVIVVRVRTVIQNNSYFQHLFYQTRRYKCIVFLQTSVFSFWKQIKYSLAFYFIFLELGFILPSYLLLIRSFDLIINKYNQSEKSQMQIKNSRLQKHKESLFKFSVFKKNTIQIENKIQQINTQKRRRMSVIAQRSQNLDFSALASLEESEENSECEYGFYEKYILGMKIGQGGNGEVYKCQHIQTKKELAVKIFKMEAEHLRDLKKNFLFMKQLRCQSIIKYKALYFNHQKHQAYLVMELLPYPDLMNVKLMSEEELKHIVSLLLNAIEYMHNRNICHRDIKPENILYDRKNKQIKLIDFGISKKTFLRGARRDMLTIIGTPYYLAPDFFIGGGYDERVDLWALGVTIYKLIAGVTPFQSEYHSDTVKNIMKGEASFKEKVWNNYSSFTKDFIQRLLKSKEERMTVKEAKAHFWLAEVQKSAISKTRKRASSLEKTCEAHLLEKLLGEQMKNDKRSEKFMHATHREEGEQFKWDSETNDSCYSPQSDVLHRKIDLMENAEFDFIDSDDESQFVMPSSKNKIKNSETMDVMTSSSHV